MQNNVSLFIGLRYLRSRRRNNFISFVSLFAFLGMALGVFALIVVLSVMNGFDRELKERILRLVPHGYVSTVEPLSDWQNLAETLPPIEGLRAYSPFIEGNGLISFNGSVHALQLQAVMPERVSTVSDVGDFMLVGDVAQLSEAPYSIILGSLLARYLDVTVGDKVNITLPQLTVTPAGVFPRVKRFTVVGAFEVGAQLDQHMALIHIRDAQKLFRKGDTVDGLRLRFDNIYQAPVQIPALLEKLGSGYHGEDWSVSQGNLFQAVKMEKTVVGVMLGIVIAVAAFNIITTLIMMIAEKRSDIAVLRTMGMSAHGITGIFLVQGLMLGLIGIVLGMGLGVAVALQLPDIVAWFERMFGAEIFDPSVYFVTSMPSELRWNDVLWVGSIAFVISFFASCYPAYRASKIEPAEALRYNI